MGRNPMVKQRGAASTESGPWWSSRIRRLASGLLGLALACGGRVDPTGEMPLAGVLQPVAEIAVGPVATLRAQVDFFRPLDLAVVGDSVYVVDNGNDHVVVLGRNLEVLGVLGREGEGPGEYRQPVGIRPSPGGVMVSDMGNSRFTEIDRTGAVLRAFQAPSGLQSFAVTGAGAVIVPSRDGAHHFSLIRADGPEELGRWPGDSAAEPDRDERFSIEAGFRDPRVAVTAGDTVHVFDEREAVLYKYTSEGELMLRRSVPTALRDSAAAAMQRLVGGLARQGLNVLSSPLSRGLFSTPDGRLLLRMPAGGTFALLIDPATYSAQRIDMPSDSSERAGFRSARAAAVVDSVLYVVRDVSIHAYRLRPAQ